MLKGCRFPFRAIIVKWLSVQGGCLTVSLSTIHLISSHLDGFRGTNSNSLNDRNAILDNYKGIEVLTESVGNLSKAYSTIYIHRWRHHLPKSILLPPSGVWLAVQPFWGSQLGAQIISGASETLRHESANHSHSVSKSASVWPAVVSTVVSRNIQPKAPKLNDHGPWSFLQQAMRCFFFLFRK
jgi:hypothetical protein